MHWSLDSQQSKRKLAEQHWSGCFGSISLASCFIYCCELPYVASAHRMTPRMCGIIGIYKHDGDASVELYEGLLMLQHRGQDSAGMVTTDWLKFKEHKENGLVKDVFADKKTIESLKGKPARVFCQLQGVLLRLGISDCSFKPANQSIIWQVCLRMRVHA